MEYAVVQTSPEPPPPDLLREAFTSTEILSDHDISSMRAEPFGILIDHLTEIQAQALQRTLADDNINTAIVHHNDLFNLPKAMHLLRAECHPKHFTVYDALGRPNNVHWDNIQLIVAGVIGHVVTHRARSQTKQQSDKQKQFSMENISPGEITKFDSQLDIILDIKPFRYQIDGSRFQYSYLGDRMENRAIINYISLVSDIINFAPHAETSRGARALASNFKQPFIYPDHQSYENELAWFIWQYRSDKYTNPI